MRSLTGSAVGVLAAVALTAQDAAQFERGQQFLAKYCQTCHSAKAAAGGFQLDSVRTPESLRSEAKRWTSAAARTANFEMPPKGAPAPTLDEREQFARWADQALKTAACAAGIRPGPAVTRRLNRDEYTSTVRDLLDIHLDIGSTLPADGAGGEGFDNAAETLFLSPLHSEKYMDAARLAVDFAAKEFKSRRRILVAEPGPGVSEREAARRILAAFLPRAFRRPVAAAELAPYLSLYDAARAQKETHEGAVFFSLRAVLVSPMFLYRMEPPNPTATARPIDDFALASRLSYFLWGSMPDELLLDVAAAGKLNDDAVLRQLVGRMLINDRSLDFTTRFIDQWLHTRELDGDKAPDAKLYPAYSTDEELRSDIRTQPVLFFRELLVMDRSVLELIDSNGTIGTSNLAKLYNGKMPTRRDSGKQPHWLELAPGHQRGGLLGMPAILAVSSYPYRTSPVLRGAWVLENLLGTPPPPPPPDVPALEEVHAENPKTLRERLSQHRSNPVCASCHSRIDGIGFALENFDVMGRWRSDDAGRPIDASGELADGTKFEGPDGLRKMLMDRKHLFLKTLASKMLGYALGRGLTLDDSCTVDQIVAHVEQNDYRARALIEAVVLSVPFRQQAPGAAEGKTKKTD